MLTKSLVRYRLRKGAVRPSFLNPEDPDLLTSASDLIEVFRDGMGKGRDELASMTSDIIEVSPFEAIIARGFEKLLLDRCTFETPEDEALPNLRARVFAQTSKMLSEQHFDQPRDYLDAVSSHFQQPAGELAVQLYSDLPGQHPLVAFRDLSAPRLLHRYNCSLIQWLLCHSDKLNITLHGTRTGALRQIFKYLRFNQLLARVTKKQKGVFLLEIEGPLSMFYQTKKYGLRLALFFPALLHQETWSMEAEIAVSASRKGLLTVDQDCGIKPEKERFHAYVPKELRDFGKSLESRLVGWKAKPYPGFISLEGDYCFPDFTLEHESGRKISIELFHRWHKDQFISRLQQMEKMKPGILILGVEQKLAKDPMTADHLAGSTFFADYGFTFRELPTVNVVKPLLEQISKN